MAGRPMLGGLGLLGCGEAPATPVHPQLGIRDYLGVQVHTSAGATAAGAHGLQLGVSLAGAPQSVLNPEIWEGK